MGIDLFVFDFSDFEDSWGLLFNYFAQNDTKSKQIQVTELLLFV